MKKINLYCPFIIVVFLLITGCSDNSDIDKNDTKALITNTFNASFGVSESDETVDTKSVAISYPFAQVYLNSYTASTGVSQSIALDVTNSSFELVLSAQKNTTQVQVNNGTEIITFPCGFGTSFYFSSRNGGSVNFTGDALIDGKTVRSALYSSPQDISNSNIYRSPSFKIYVNDIIEIDGLTSSAGTALYFTMVNRVTMFVPHLVLYTGEADPDKLTGVTSVSCPIASDITISSFIDNFPSSLNLHTGVLDLNPDNFTVVKMNINESEFEPKKLNLVSEGFGSQVETLLALNASRPYIFSLSCSELTNIHHIPSNKLPVLKFRLTSKTNLNYTRYASYSLDNYYFLEGGLIHCYVFMNEDQLEAAFDPARASTKSEIILDEIPLSFAVSSNKPLF